MDGQTDGRMDGWTFGRMESQKDGWTDGMTKTIYPSTYLYAGGYNKNTQK